MTFNIPIRPTPDFGSQAFVTEHLKSILSFYYPQCLDLHQGGYYQSFDEQGKVSKSNTQRHLVSSTRLCINFAMAAKQFNNQDYLQAAVHGVNYLRAAHLNGTTGGYAWIVDKATTVDGDNYCYGIAFVLMAYARTYQAGASEVYDYIEETFALMEQHWWREEDQLYVDVIDESWQQVSAYRGQNANMHCCEAMIAAYEATGQQHYLERAMLLAQRMTVQLAGQCDGKIWEHYDQQWQADFAYNAGDTENKLRPWGYQPGHFTEWAKLLLILHSHNPQNWLVQRAKGLFDKAMEIGFDPRYGGLYYGVAPSGEVCSDSKYSWVQAETIAAAAIMATTLNNGLYACIYQQLWQYAWTYMIDHKLKCWHRNLTRDNIPFTQSSVAMGRTDYHSICACIEILKTLPETKQQAAVAAKVKYPVA